MGDVFRARLILALAAGGPSSAQLAAYGDIAPAAEPNEIREMAMDPQLLLPN